MVVEGGLQSPPSPPSPPGITETLDPDRPSNVSLLANKYLLFDTPNSSTNSSKASCVVKTYQRCIKIETKEQFSCKVVTRNQEGLQIVVGYHRLDEGCDAISKVHEVVLSPKSLYMIMPATYGNVHAYLLAKKKLKEPEAANIFRQMVQAVQFCHSKGIVLRDLKMGKFVFHDKERTIVRLDTLEDAVLLNDLNDDGLSDKHGCPNYVSPEKAEILRSNKKYPGKATDMWGLGVILYTLLVGRYPFNDEDHSKLFVKIRRGNYSIPDNLTGSAKFLIRCLLQRDPNARPSCGEILKHSWLNSGTQQGTSSGNNSNLNSSRNSSGLNSGSRLRANDYNMSSNAVHSNNSAAVPPSPSPTPVSSGAGAVSIGSSAGGNNVGTNNGITSVPYDSLDSTNSSAGIGNNTPNIGTPNPHYPPNSIVPSTSLRAINVGSHSHFSNSYMLSDHGSSEFHPLYDILGSNSKHCYPKPNDSEDQVVPNID